MFIPLHFFPYFVFLLEGVVKHLFLLNYNQEMV